MIFLLRLATVDEDWEDSDETRSALDLSEFNGVDSSLGTRSSNSSKSAMLSSVSSWFVAFCFKPASKLGWRGRGFKPARNDLSRGVFCGRVDVLLLWATDPACDVTEGDLSIGLSGVDVDRDVSCELVAWGTFAVFRVVVLGIAVGDA